MWYVIMYLAAVVLANLSVAQWGPSVAIVNAFLFIGLDLTARDALHEQWHGRRLGLKMAALIASGSLLSWFLNRDAGQIALASFLAFAGAAITDTAVYQRLHHRPRWQKMNGSNLVSAAVDSLIFPAVAFGWPLLLPVVVGQFVAKVFGGAIWSWVIIQFGRERATAVSRDQS